MYRQSGDAIDTVFRNSESEGRSYFKFIYLSVKKPYAESATAKVNPSSSYYTANSTSNSTDKRKEGSKVDAAG